ncbi:MAG: NmrA family NAD(P)-binding protein [Akkermansiaceae bacterium]|nr:NmrA family NAD(P)-binding protein [Armatimonadota bacterium]
MSTKILVAGATGNLGKRIVRSLIARGATVVALGRTGTADEKVQALKGLGAQVALVDMASVAEITDACAGAACVVSSLQGLRDVIVDTQSVLLEASVAAGVPRFIPSDFSTDFTRLPGGENRNFDLRREFHGRLSVASISATAIFNGAFAEILTYNIPLFDFQKKVVGYWENPDWRLDFTTMDDTASYTAAAALDSDTPSRLRIASFQVSPRELADFTRDVMKTPFELVCMGSLEDLRVHNKSERAAHPEGESELYASWQQSQYMQSMFSTHHESLDNNRYPDVTWTSLRDVIVNNATNTREGDER